MFRTKYEEYANSAPNAFSQDEIDFLDSKYSDVRLLAGGISSPVELNEIINSGSIDGMKNHKISMTPSEYIFYRTMIENPQNVTIFIDKSDIDEFKANDQNFADKLKRETFKFMGETLYSNFLKMHFTRKQSQYHTSEVVGGAGFYNIPSAYGDTGETLGYIKELYAMASMFTNIK